MCVYVCMYVYICMYIYIYIYIYIYMMYNIRMLDILIAREEECNQELDSDDTIAQFCVLHHPAIM